MPPTQPSAEKNTGSDQNLHQTGPLSGQEGVDNGCIESADNYIQGGEAPPENVPQMNIPCMILYFLKKILKDEVPTEGEDLLHFVSWEDRFLPKDMEGYIPLINLLLEELIRQESQNHLSWQVIKAGEDFIESLLDMIYQNYRSLSIEEMKKKIEEFSAAERKEKENIPLELIAIALGGRGFIMEG
jgi:hypothetical protein